MHASFLGDLRHFFHQMVVKAEPAEARKLAAGITIPRILGEEHLAKCFFFLIWLPC